MSSRGSPPPLTTPCWACRRVILRDAASAAAAT
eukprot:CAMPEP_0197601500 /NCGR_PEP_ID=MMETSP1326-20131121/35419_1 /TAXON_ID=1155430 /ORGANISM="Genus nov. species nov., Strain RCC2288" /LENGTH=32 /DNA_ID= /DNA_START= /DNA_END= /DNA_ORIENTATION=